MEYVRATAHAVAEQLDAAFWYHISQNDDNRIGRSLGVFIMRQSDVEPTYVRLAEHVMQDENHRQELQDAIQRNTTWNMYDNFKRAVLQSLPCNLNIAERKDATNVRVAPENGRDILSYLLDDFFGEDVDNVWRDTDETMMLQHGATLTLFWLATTGQLGVALQRLTSKYTDLALSGNRGVVQDVLRLHLLTALHETIAHNVTDTEWSAQEPEIVEQYIARLSDATTLRLLHESVQHEHVEKANESNDMLDSLRQHVTETVEKIRE